MQLNNVILAGNLTRDPEMKYTNSGVPVVQFCLAVNERYKLGDQVKDEVSFISIVTYARLAEVCLQHLSKGASCIVEGKVRQDRWEDQNQKKQSKTRILAHNVQFIRLRKEI